MKRIILLACAALAIATSFAQKSYVTIYVDLDIPSNNWVLARLGGDVPEGMRSCYNKSYDRLNEGQIINMLAAEGFQVESITGIGDGVGTNQSNNVHTALILMSKPVGNNDDSAIRPIANDSNTGEAHEVARYNLQGIPVAKDEKGVQIVVYSNYTTKTVIVE